MNRASALRALEMWDQPSWANKMAVEFGSDLGCYADPQPDYLPDLIQFAVDHLVSNTTYRLEFHAGIFAAVAAGFAEEHKIAVPDIPVTIAGSRWLIEAKSVGKYLGRINPPAARIVAISKQDVWPEAFSNIVHLVIDAAFSAIRFTSIELLRGLQPYTTAGQWQATSVAVESLLLLMAIEPRTAKALAWFIDPDMEARSDTPSAAYVEAVKPELAHLLSRGYVVDDIGTIRRMYRSPLPQGSWSISFTGRTKLLDMFRASNTSSPRILTP